MAGCRGACERDSSPWRRVPCLTDASRAPLDILLEDPDDRRLASDILGSADPATIHHALDTFTRHHLAAAVSRVTFCQFSIGAGIGFELTDGRRLFLKAWSAAADVAALRAACTVQDALARSGLPAPRIVLAPSPFTVGHAAVMEWVGRGRHQDAGAPPLRTAIARGLARQIEAAQAYVDLPGLARHEYPRGGGWGPTHNVLFDFERTAEGAEWIDSIGAEARERARAGEGRIVVGHRDWRAGNMRFENDDVSIVYDWDALATGREPELVGMAAAVYAVAHEVDPAPVFPDPDAMAAFIADYEEAAGRTFGAGELGTAWAAGTHLLAYVARSEHALAVPESPAGARGVLRLHSETLLAAAR